MTGQPAVTPPNPAPMLPHYNFKPCAEAGWAAFGAVALTLLAAAASADPSAILSDPRAWATALVVSSLRAAGAAVLVVVGKSLRAMAGQGKGEQ